MPSLEADDHKDNHNDRRSDTSDVKFPIGQVTTLAICKFSEPIAFNSVIAYAYVMVQWLHDDDTNASFYAGLLVSAYAFGEVLTAAFWGWLSDRVGRKPIVLSGLLGVAASCVMFGLAKQYWVALLARLIGGMLNGNVAVMQTMLAEQIKNPKHEPVAYATHPFVWFAGGIIGSAMGGYLAKPAQFYPSWFSPDGIFGTYPFLLPNLFAVVCIVLAVAQGFIFLNETNPVSSRGTSSASERSDDPQPIDEETPLLRASQSNSDIHDNNNPSKHSLQPKSSQQGLTDMAGAMTLCVDSAIGPVNNTLPDSPTQPREVEESSKNPNRPPTFNFAVIMLITSFVITSYHGMGYGSLLPVYLLDKPSSSSGSSSSSLHESSLDLRGGLGYDVHDVGSFMAVNGVIAILVQTLIFPPFVSYFGVWTSFVSTVFLYPFGYAVIPLLTALPANVGRAAGIYGLMLFQNFINIIIPPCALVLIKNATPSSTVLGTVNGACMSFVCAARTVSPPLEGLIYGAGGSAAAWWSLSGVALVATVQLLWVPKPRHDRYNGDQSSVEA